jgi:hypothetical protein
MHLTLPSHWTLHNESYELLLSVIQQSVNRCVLDKRGNEWASVWVFRL